MHHDLQTEFESRLGAAERRTFALTNRQIDKSLAEMQVAAAGRARCVRLPTLSFEHPGPMNEALLRARGTQLRQGCVASRLGQCGVSGKAVVTLFTLMHAAERVH